MELVKINQVKPNPKNPRIIKDDKFKKLVKSIQEFPDMLNKRPLIVFTDVDKKYVVLGGNMRLKACNEIGLKEVPVILADEWTEEQKAEFLIKDNVGFGEWDWDDLANEWNAEKLDEWGLDIPNFEPDQVLEAEEDDYDGTLPEEPITVLGDLYEIGEHRLLCGDSTDSDQVERLMNGEKADMVFTDPPYGVKMSRSLVSGKNNSILNDDLSKDDLNKLINDAFVNSILFSKDCHFYWWVGFRAYSLMENIFINNNIKIDNCIVWNKPSIGLGKTGYRYKHELCIFKGEIKNKSLSDVWDFGRDNAGLHPTMKPIELISYALENSSKENNIIIDLFLGSGSTMVASHQLKRKCYGMELDPKYCDVIVKRMIKLDDTLTVKRNGVDVTNEWK
jgi:site-specific DNA-methyltransferase (adenine-specific)